AGEQVRLKPDTTYNGSADDSADQPFHGCRLPGTTVRRTTVPRTTVPRTTVSCHGSTGSGRSVRLQPDLIRRGVIMLQDFRFAIRSLARAKGLSLTVVMTLALGIGANAAIFSVVRGVLLRPLVNRDEARLLYIRQSAAGNG